MDLAIAEDGEGNDQNSAVSELVHGSLYLDMLHDMRRNKQYRLALEREIRPGACKVGNTRQHCRELACLLHF